jgi:hypothetical protein
MRSMRKDWSECVVVLWVLSHGIGQVGSAKLGAFVQKNHTHSELPGGWRV